MRFSQRISRWLKKLQSFADHPTYPFIVCLISALDGLIFIIPVDGIMITTIFARPRKWLVVSIAIAVGTVIGSMILAYSIRYYGPTLLNMFAPGIEKTKAWHKANHLMNHYGAYAIFFTGISLVLQQPTVILAAMSKMHLTKIFFILLVSRLLRYGVLAWVAAKSPRLLKRLWSVKTEVTKTEAAIRER